jgi:hypothetical protein
MLRRASAALMTAILMSGCGGDDGVDLPIPAQIEKVGNGDNQRATAGNRLAVPFEILVTASDGSAVPREKLIWAVSQGDGAILSDTVSVTDGTGIAQAFLTLGPEAGEYVVQAALARKRDATITFAAHAAPAPVLSEVDPGSFTSGDVVTIRGSFITDSTIIEFDGKQAAIQYVSALGQGLAATVPRCLAPGDVSIIARVGMAVSAPITGTFQTTTEPIRLGVGEYLSLDPEVLAGCATFEDAPGDREYLFAPQSVTSTLGRTLNYRFRGDSSDTPIPLVQQRAQSSDRPLILRFDDFLRGQEAELAGRPWDPPATSGPLMAPIQLDIKVGDRRLFKVCSDISCSALSDFANVTGEVKYAGVKAIIYQDMQAPADGLAQDDFDEMGALFDLDLYDIVTRTFGSESDIDRNGRVIVLMTPVVNGLTEKLQCSTSFITGFFFPLDLEPSASNDSRSNQAEIFYALTPDPQGTVSCDHSVDRIKRLVPVTFVHEFQHMINFNQHRILRGSNSEETWLNEAMSHMSEEQAALHFESLGDSTRFTAFALGDLFNAYDYLSATEQYFPLFSEGTGSLPERGATWLLLRWLADQKGDEVLRLLSETGLVGTENLISAVGEPLAKVLADWFLANYVSNHPDLSPVPARLRYSTWNFRATYANLHEQDASLFPHPFPIVPQVFSGGNFDVTGTLGSGSGAYYRVVQVAGQRGFTVELVDGSGNPLSGPAEPRLNVIRIK